MGPSAENVSKFQGKCKNNALEKMTVLGPFLGPWMAISCHTKETIILRMFPMFPVFFHFLTTL